ncbi:signal peptidase II [Candidatus Woesearchaeota archaeon]|nr:signal peptidase II [Candidatus Woesearchaeota archaeon]
MKSIKNKKALTVSITSIIIIVLDQLLKYLIVKRLEPGRQITLISNFLHITNIHNFGAAFSLFQGETLPLILFSIAVIIVIIKLYKRIPKLLYVQISTALLAGGVIGNLIDRIKLGYVIDFIDFTFWPAFNIADSAITLGVLGLIIYFIKKK